MAEDLVGGGDGLAVEVVPHEDLVRDALQDGDEEHPLPPRYLLYIE